MVWVCVVCGCLASSAARLHQGDEPAATRSHMFWEVWWQISLGHEPEVRQHDANLVSVHSAIALQAHLYKHLDQAIVDLFLVVDASRVDVQEVMQKRLVLRDALVVDTPFEIQTLVANEILA